jgi:ATP-dependent RNA helicase DDX19/DBP5
MGFQKPSKIQERALPLLLQNPCVPNPAARGFGRSQLTSLFDDSAALRLRARNMIGQSQSGTGKTAAFALTMLSRVDMDIKQPQVCARGIESSHER